MLNKTETPSQPTEIERKFIIKNLPQNLEQYKKNEIEQGYITISEDGTEVRLRRKNGKFIQTVKMGQGKIRNEYETEITEEQFSALWNSTQGKRLSKVRYEIPYGDHTIELDLYQGKLHGLMVAEVEFSSEQNSTEFTQPDWFGDEVTDKQEYKNQQLALNGLPGIADNQKTISEAVNSVLQKGESQ